MSKRVASWHLVLVKTLHKAVLETCLRSDQSPHGIEDYNHYIIPIDIVTTAMTPCSTTVRQTVVYPTPYSGVPYSAVPPPQPRRA